MSENDDLLLYMMSLSPVKVSCGSLFMLQILSFARASSKGSQRCLKCSINQSLIKRVLWQHFFHITITVKNDGDDYDDTLSIIDIKPLMNKM